jgi:hypothetical protein
MIKKDWREQSERVFSKQDGRNYIINVIIVCEHGSGFAMSL